MSILKIKLFYFNKNWD